MQLSLVRTLGTTELNGKLVDGRRGLDQKKIKIIKFPKFAF